MSYNVITPLEERYCNHSRYCVQKTTARDALYGPLSPWPWNRDAQKSTPDDALLKEALSGYMNSGETTLAERVFGSQARQQGIGLRHLANVLYERALLHNKRLQDIDHRLTALLDRLSVLKMHFAVDPGRSQQQLEKLVIELERQRHEEQTSFWKDNTEIRHQLFEGASEYGSAKRRKDMLYGVEVKDV